MKRLLPLLLIPVLLPGLLLAAPKAAKTKKKPDYKTSTMETLVANARGEFDMSKNPRPFVVFLVLDQEDNMYPSFWCGKNETGKISFYASYDMLDEEVRFTQKGNMTLLVAHAAYKYGMYDQIPGGIWATNLVKDEFRITIDKFTNVEFLEAKEKRMITGKTSGNVTISYFSATLSGTIRVGAESAPFEGTAQLGFMDRTPAFTLSATFDFPGTALGLAGTSGTGIKASLYTSSTPSLKIPEITKFPDDKVNDLMLEM